jgi:hypothetical protein
MKGLLCVLSFVPVFLHAQTINITTPKDTICSGSFVHFKATVAGIATPHFKWQINSSSAGTDSLGFTTHTLNNNDTVSCLLTNGAGDTVFAASNKIVITVEHMPVVSPITGGSIYICAGSTATFSDATPGGKWSSSDTTSAIVTGGIVKGIQGGPENSFSSANIFYTISNSCGAVSSSTQVFIYGQPEARFFLNFPGHPPDFISSLCVGQMALINDGDGTGGSFYSVNGHCGFLGGGVVGSSVGADYIFDVVTNVCGSDTVGRPLGVIGTPPTPSIISPSTNICVGDTINLSASVTGFPSWAARNGSVTINSSTGHVRGINSGLDTIFLSASQGCGSSPADTITINVLLPEAIKGPDSLCVGQTITLRDTTSSGVWSSSTPAVATVDQAGIVSSASAGAVLISYSFGACSVKKQVIVNPIPLITGGDNLCYGPPVQLYGDTTNGRWNTTDTFVAAITNTGLLHILSPGTATITYTSKFGCTGTKAVTINRLPLVQGQANIFFATTVHLTSTIGGGAWESSDASIAIVDNSGNVYGNNNGDAVITYTAPTGCTGVMPVSVSFTKDEMILYPNPAKSEFVIFADTGIYHSFSLHTYDGREILRQSLTDSLTKVNVRSLRAGIYIVTLYADGDRTFVWEFVKE